MYFFFRFLVYKILYLFIYLFIPRRTQSELHIDLFSNAFVRNFYLDYFHIKASFTKDPCHFPSC